MIGLFGIQMAFENHTILHPTSFQPFEYQTSLVFRSPLYMLNINLPFRSSSSVFLLKMTSLKMLQLLNRRVSSDDLTQRRRIHFKRNPVILHFKCEIKYINGPETRLQWGSEKRLSSVFKWSKIVWWLKLVK